MKIKLIMFYSFLLITEIQSVLNKKKQINKNKNEEIELIEQKASTASSKNEQVQLLEKEEHYIESHYLTWKKMNTKENTKEKVN